MKKASAKIRNKVKTKLARTINKLESLFGRESNKQDDFKHHNSRKNK